MILRTTFVLFVAAFLAVDLVCADEPPALNPKDKLVVETVLRMKSFDLNSSEPAKAAVLRYLKSQPGTDQYFELIGRFQPTEITDDLVAYSLSHADETGGVRAADALFAMGQEKALLSIAKGDNAVKATSAIGLIGRSGGKKTVTMLLPLLTDSNTTVELQSAAIAALGRQTAGQKEVLGLVAAGKLANELKFAAANVLLSSDDEAIAAEASKYLELPATKDSKPLPTVAELVKRKGNVDAGGIVFRTEGTCINCHKVRGEGKEVGPDLTEIGSKLSREAMYVSILDPSAAVSHNFETYSLLTEDGSTVTGLLISETDQAVTLRTSEGIDKTVAQDSIEILKKQSKSLMPQDLQRLMTVDQLVDLVEYLMTLRKSGGATD
ncbi:c-type cytochrome [Stieleria varia]|uniref:Cytochrome c n=1 Tax=Stieleria varia TaxID=2528005 RepID=A0A5C6B6G1_9BACT|nr:c-type cytochrome [Stieleria varia]TWU06104.1 Cytochrome c [Stieleria varia]